MQHEKKWIHAVKIYILIRLIESTYSQCDVGAYEDENTGECVHTPLHNDLVTRIEGCDRGQHYNSVLQLCVDVPGGYYVSNYESLPVLGPCSRVDEDANLFYCPKGSPISPIPVPEGYYGVGGDGNKTREAIVLAEMGTFALNGVRNHCPAGTYGDSEGLKQKNCSGLCTLGNFCPLGSSTPTLCPAGTYGDSEGLKDDACSGLCPLGNFCPLGSSTPTLCPAGTYGDSEGLKDDACSGLCPQGKFCPLGTSTPLNCGAVNVFCPTRLIVTTLCITRSLHDRRTRKNSIRSEPM